MPNIPSHIGIVIDNCLEDVSLRKKLLTNICKIYDICFNIGINEITFYGFSDFYDEIAYNLILKGAKLLVIGNTESAYFPNDLLPFAQERTRGNGIKVNVLVNYSIVWDTDNKVSSYHYKSNYNDGRLESVSSIDLIEVWNGEREFKKFLPLQTSKANIYIEREPFVNFKPLHIYNAIRCRCCKSIKYEANKI
ncbi:hypothetical protein ACJDT4_00560 [Clostridium neuense]|uniref:Uncharacterized protein n=1 Tax=Clostridium neuense TaxID=1728934 RepID=A0ABW8T9N7_9CLOT